MRLFCSAEKRRAPHAYSETSHRSLAHGRFLVVRGPVESHYASRSLVDTVLAAVDAAGLPAGPLKTSDLAPLDQFHVRGLAATKELAALAGIDATHARARCRLRHRRAVAPSGRDRSAARSSAIDLTAEYCRVAEALTARTGLADKVTFKAADALNLPFEDGSFDVVWTQHVAMNIADRPRLYSRDASRAEAGRPARASTTPSRSTARSRSIPCRGRAIRRPASC